MKLPRGHGHRRAKTAPPKHVAAGRGPRQDTVRHSCATRRLVSASKSPSSLPGDRPHQRKRA
eukprot:10139195-Alexandrium_andersonii.AAC.1